MFRATLCSSSQSCSKHVEEYNCVINVLYNVIVHQVGHLFRIIISVIIIIIIIDNDGDVGGGGSGGGGGGGGGSGGGDGGGGGGDGSGGGNSIFLSFGECEAMGCKFVCVIFLMVLFNQ